MRTALREKLRSVHLTRGFCVRPSNQLINSTRYPGGLEVWPTYFTITEQKILLRVSLQMLDNSESMRSRKQRRNYLKALPAANSNSLNIQDVFLPNEYYEFQKVPRTMD